MTEFKSHPDFPGYLIGIDGSVWSCWKRTQRSAILVETRVKLLTPGRNDGGYPFVRLKYRGTPKQVIRRVGRLVLETFTGFARPGEQARHKDGDVLNNSIGNLCWGTAKDNAADREGHGTTARGRKVGTAKISEADAIEIRRLYGQGGHSWNSLAKQFGISKREAGRIINGEYWKHVS